MSAPLARAAGKRNRGVGKQIIHHAVELVALQPLTRIGPHFAHNVCFGIDGLDALAKLLPEAGRADLEWHIKPPSVNALANPELGHLHDKLAHLRVIGVELRQRAIATQPT